MEIDGSIFIGGIAFEGDFWVSFLGCVVGCFRSLEDLGVQVVGMVTCVSKHLGIFT